MTPEQQDTPADTTAEGYLREAEMMYIEAWEQFERGDLPGAAGSPGRFHAMLALSQTASALAVAKHTVEGPQLEPEVLNTLTR